MTEIPEFTALLGEIRWIGTPPILQRARKNLGDSRSSIAWRSRRTGLLADLPSPHACLQDRSHFSAHAACDAHVEPDLALYNQ